VVVRRQDGKKSNSMTRLVRILPAICLVTGTGFATVPEDASESRHLEVAAVYNDEAIQIRFRYQTEQPSWYHQVWRYSDGEWVRHGSGVPGSTPYRLYEDRISMMLSDEAVPDFARFGGFMTAHEGMRHLDSAASTEAVEDHPVLGREMGRSDVRKFIPGSREDEAAAEWDDLKSDDELQAMRKRGEFIDLWQWRSHRSNPVGKADNGYVLHYRLNASGRGMFTTNWDDDTGQPAWMFDPEVTGMHALSWQRLIDGEYGQDDYYYLAESHAVRFDPNHGWQEGDVIPQRLLREPSGSRGAIAADGRYHDGAWHVALTRSLDAPDPKDSKSLKPGGQYTVAFAVHEGKGARWHHVSMPLTLILDNGQDEEPERITPRIIARYVDGNLDGAEFTFARVPLIHPGQITWQWLHSAGHPGYQIVRDTPTGFHDVSPLHPFYRLAEWIIHHDETGKLPEEVSRNQ